MKARKYTKSELRIMRIFIVCIFSIGAFLSGFGVLLMLTAGPRETISYTPGKKRVQQQQGEYAEAMEHKPPFAKRKKSFPAGVAYIIGGIPFLCLGVAGGVGLKRVVNNKGRDVEFDPIEENVA